MDIKRYATESRPKAVAKIPMGCAIKLHFVASAI